MAGVDTVTLRVVEPGDHAFLVDLYASTRAAELALLPWDAATRTTFVAQQFALQDASWSAAFPALERFLVLVATAPAGRVYVERSGPTHHLVDVAITPEVRGRGVGSFLLARLTAEADACGATMSLHVVPGNPAQRLYERFGFHAVDHRPFHTRMERQPTTAA